MSCPLCGEVCRCVTESGPAQNRSRTRVRFQSDSEANARAHPSAVLIDPEAYDASEQQFAASLETPSLQPDPRFVADNPTVNRVAEPLCAEAKTSVSVEEPEAEATIAAETLLRSHQQNGLDDGAPSWRREVAARLNNYRARRRPGQPRYASLRLNFEASEPSCSSRVKADTAPRPTPPTRQAVAMQDLHYAEAAEPLRAAAAANPAETTGKIIEFPRSELPRSTAALPPRPLDELAEPVLDRPRILEAPELLPSPPALGGMLIEPVEEPPDEKRPGFELPLQSAPMSRRIIAVAADALLVGLAFTAFAYIFFRITAQVPPLRLAAELGALIAGLFWAAYQYLLLVYVGTTPGLKLAKLRLSRFDGSPVPRRLRRWRVLATVLSAVSLGLGYAWCFLDEDQLCWHDRITRTYMAPKG